MNKNLIKNALMAQFNTRWQECLDEIDKHVTAANALLARFRDAYGHEVTDSLMGELLRRTPGKQPRSNDHAATVTETPISEEPTAKSPKTGRYKRRTRRRNKTVAISMTDMKEPVLAAVAQMGTKEFSSRDLMQVLNSSGYKGKYDPAYITLILCGYMRGISVRRVPRVAGSRQMMNLYRAKGTVTLGKHTRLKRQKK